MAFWLNVHCAINFNFFYWTDFVLKLDINLSVENNYREPGAKDIAKYMADLDYIKESKIMSKSTTTSPLPSIEVQRSLRGTISIVENSKSDYHHAMQCICRYIETFSYMASFLKPIVTTWKKHGFLDSYEVTWVQFPYNHLNFNTAEIFFPFFSLMNPLFSWMALPKQS